MRAARSLAMTTLTALLAACGGGDGAGGPDSGPDYGDAAAWTVETTLSANAVEAGGSVDVTCTVTGPGGPAQVAVAIEVTPADGWTLDGAKVTFAKSGDYQVACTAPAIPAEDATPADVTVSAGRPSSVDTTVQPGTVAAGEKAAVTCLATDAGGNPAVGEFEVVTVPAEGVVVTNQGGGAFQAEGRTAGTYTVTCGLKGGATDPSPAGLQVTAGALDTVRTVLDGETMKAGETMKGRCEAVDAFGNVLAGVATTVESEPQLTVTSSTLGFEATGTKTGKYTLTCNAVEGTAKTEPAELTIEAREVVGIALKLIPAKPAYSVYEQVEVGFDLVDTYGNPVPGGAITEPTVDPETGITRTAPTKFKFDAEGKYTFAACVVDDPSRCDDIVGWCDGTAPLLTVTYPERGATLDGERRVVVTGTVNESVSQVASVTINGQDAQLGPDGSFQFPMQPNQGMNLIDAKATDTFGNEVRTLRSYLFSTVWYPMGQPDPAASYVPEALKAYLDDTLFYNADPADEATISAILVTALKDLDIAAILPSPVTTVEQIGCGYEVYIDRVVFGTPDVKVKPTFGGLQIDAIIPDFVGDVRLVKVNGGFLCPGDQSGTVSADQLILNMRVNMDVDPATHLIRIFAGETSLNLEGFDIELDNVFFDFLVGILKGTLEGLLKDQVEPLLVDTVNGLADTVNEALAKPFEVAVDAPLPGMSNLQLRIALQPQKIDFTPEGGAVDLNGAILADHLMDRTILGSIGHASCLSATPEVFGFDLGNPEKLMLAVFDDVLNTALYSVWDSKFLNIHITAEDLAEMGTDLSQYGLEGLDATTAPLIPPVLTSCNPAGSMNVQLGDFYLEAEFGLMGSPVDLHTFLFLELRLDLTLVDDPEKGRAISITVNKPDLVDMDIVYVNEEWVGQEYLFEDLIKGALIPVLFDEVLKEPILFAIPGFNLKDLVSGGSLPISLPDKDLTIVPEVLGHDQGYLHIAAGLELREPAPEEPPATP